MTSPILVTGGTGTLGRRVVPLLREAGFPVRVLSRHDHTAEDGIEYVTGDLTRGEGVEAAVAGVHTFLHLAGTAKGDETKTRNLVQAASRAGNAHIVYISVVGADRVTIDSWVDRNMFGYYGSKRAAEEVIAESGLRWTTLRATQFHQSMYVIMSQMAKLPVVPVPSGFSFQPVDADEVATRLVELALGRPSGLVSDYAGPRVYEMASMMRQYLHATGKRRMILPMPMFGKAAGAMRAGANLAPEYAVGRRSWEEYLAERVAQPQSPVQPDGKLAAESTAKR